MLGSSWAWEQVSGHDQRYLFSCPVEIAYLYSREYRSDHESLVLSLLLY